MADNELSFLEYYLQAPLDRYSDARFLMSDFDAWVWELDFGQENPLLVNWHVNLPDGKPLTSPEHSVTLTIFKKWVLLQDSVEAGAGLEVAIQTRQKRVRRVLHLIDFLLLNANELQIAEYGLELVTEDEARLLLATIHSHTRLAFGLYSWGERLTDWLRREIKLIDPLLLADAISKKSALSGPTLPEEDRMLSLSDDELIQARALIYVKGWYNKSLNSYDYKLTPNTARLSEAVFQCAVCAPAKMPVPLELAAGFRDSYHRELAHVPCRTNEFRGDAPMDDIKFGQYLSAFRSIGLLTAIDLPISTPMLDALTSATPLSQNAEFSTVGRTRTLPQSIVFDSAKNAIEFTKYYGADIVDSYLRLAERASKAEMTIMEFAKQADISPFLTRKLKLLGVRGWIVTCEQGNGKTADYFVRIRKNEGLYELIRVLYGSVQMVVGVLMARRAGELVDLMVGTCLNKRRTHLVFENRKSGTLGIREKEARPIPPEAAEMIGHLERLQKGLKKQNLIDETSNLFAYPTMPGMLVKLRHPQFCANFDYFCDYTQTLCDLKGRRFYIRQHQLRRFFAMLFFWGGRYGMLDTLRWFMGHTDIEHLYRYITETTSGKALKSVKAAYVVDSVRCGGQEFSNDDTKTLQDLLEERFKTRQFELLDTEELEEQIEDWLDEGVVNVEPEFWENDEGQQYRILVKVVVRKDG